MVVVLSWSCSVLSDQLLYLAELTELFQNHKFVGCVDQTRALIQHQVQEIKSFQSKWLLLYTFIVDIHCRQSCIWWIFQELGKLFVSFK